MSGPSAELSAFSRETFDRPAILRHVSKLAEELTAGARVLDAGAGSAPYRELFSHCDYVTVDWQHSEHTGERGVDVVAALDALPFEDESFDAVLSTQVLEHVEHPDRVLAELRRTLAADGRFLLTAPLVWSLHEEPYDFFRFTEHGLRSLLGESGFREVSIEPLSGYFGTIAQLLRGFESSVPRDGRRGLGSRALASVLWRISPLVARLDRYDRTRRLALGYACRARR